MCRISQRYISISYLARSGKLMKLPLAGVEVAPFCFALLGQNVRFGFDALESRNADGNVTRFYDDLREVRSPPEPEGPAFWLSHGLQARFEEIARNEQLSGFSVRTVGQFLQLRFIFEDSVDRDVIATVQDVFWAQNVRDLACIRYGDVVADWAGRSGLLKGFSLGVFLYTHGDDIFITTLRVGKSGECEKPFHSRVLEETIADPEVSLLANAIFDSIRERNTHVYAEQRDIELPRLVELAQRHLASGEAAFNGSYEMASYRGKTLPYTVYRRSLMARIGGDLASTRILAEIEDVITSENVSTKDVCILCLDRAVQNQSLQGKLSVTGCRVLTVKPEDLDSILVGGVDVPPASYERVSRIPQLDSSFGNEPTVSLRRDVSRSPRGSNDPILPPEAPLAVAHPSRNSSSTPVAVPLAPPPLPAGSVRAPPAPTAPPPRPAVSAVHLPPSRPEAPRRPAALASAPIPAVPKLPPRPQMLPPTHGLPKSVPPPRPGAPGTPPSSAAPPRVQVSVSPPRPPPVPHSANPVAPERCVRMSGAISDSGSPGKQAVSAPESKKKGKARRAGTPQGS